MTSPTGPSGFEVGQDSVTARLSIEVPADTLENLHQVTQQVALLKTELEAAARAQSSYLDYLNRVPEIQERATQAQRSYITQLERSAAVEGEIKKGAGGSTSVTEHKDPFAGMTSGTGIRSQIEHLAETDPRQALNMRAQRGDTPSAEEVQSAREDTDTRDEKREKKRKQDNADQQAKTDPTSPDSPPADPNQDPWRQLGTDVYNEMRAGNASRALRMGASGAFQIAGGSKALSMAKGAGVVGGIVAAGVAANNVVQNAGEMYQDYKNFGLMQGGGAAQGAGYEIQARMMAISPFITTEQSRRIIQMGLSQGYHGKEFETVTEMVAWNAKEMAKAQPYDSLVLTPTGFVKMGELKVGDHIVSGTDGTPSEVAQIHEWGSVEVFEVTFKDGRKTRCSADHLWPTYSEGEFRVRNTRELVNGHMWGGRHIGLFFPNTLPRYRVPFAPIVQFEEKRLPIDPYLLGLLLGDGCFQTSGTSLVAYEFDGTEFELPDGVKINKRGHYLHFVKGDGVKWRNPFMSIVRELGLEGRTKNDKFVPNIYLQSSPTQRLALLQGLMDSDGSIDKNGIACFSNSNPQLIEDVKFITDSLGGTWTQYTDPPQSNYSPMLGYWIHGRKEAHTLHIRLPEGLTPARLERKASRYKSPLSTVLKKTRGIVDIQFVGYDNCRCITIDREDGLYITDDFIVTHNSIGDSFAEIRKSVIEGGQSKQGYQAEQSLLKAVAQGSTTMSLQQIQQVAGDVKSTLIDQGVPGGVAGQLGAETAAMFPDTMALDDIKGKIVDALSTNESALYSIGQWAIRKGVKFPRNWYAADVPSILGENFNHYMWEWIENLAHVYSRDNPVMFQNIMGQYGVQLTRNQAAQLIQELQKPGNPADVARSKTQAAAAKTSTQNPIQQQISQARALVSGEIGMGAAVVKGVEKAATGHFGEAWDIFKHLPDIFRAEKSGVDAASGRYQNPILQDLIRSFGANKIEILDENGNPHQLDLNNKEQIEKLGKGEYKWRRKGSNDPGLTLEQSGQISSAEDYRKTTEGSGQVSGQLQITLSDDAKKVFQAPKQVQLTPNQQRSNAGWGDSTVNNAPPGDNLFPFLRPGG